MANEQLMVVEESVYRAVRAEIPGIVNRQALPSPGVPTNHVNRLRRVATAANNDPSVREARGVGAKAAPSVEGEAQKKAAEQKSLLLCCRPALRPQSRQAVPSRLHGRALGGRSSGLGSDERHPAQRVARGVQRPTGLQRGDEGSHRQEERALGLCEKPDMPCSVELMVVGPPTVETLEDLPHDLRALLLLVVNLGTDPQLRHEPRHGPCRSKLNVAMQHTHGQLSPSANAL
mmetsp:Transcript_115716/g.300034  ORF Transcript_115716/g.300034 Transcript_115716/m.300034 type:complete len:232 (-) Transcript_115716:80-775(-)